jgi:hypothetical protein
MTDSTRKTLILVQRVFYSKFIRSTCLTITDNFEINVGKNKITIGTHNEFHSLKCIFSEITLVLTHFVVLMTFVRQKTNTFAMNYSLMAERVMDLEQLNLGLNNLVLCPK